MTRKDYVALAEALHAAALRPGEERNVTAYLMWVNCRDMIATVLAADNPRFDRDRFVKAAQGEK